MQVMHGLNSFISSLVALLVWSESWSIMIMMSSVQYLLLRFCKNAENFCLVMDLLFTSTISTPRSRETARITA